VFDLTTCANPDAWLNTIAIEAVSRTGAARPAAAGHAQR